MRDTTRNLPNVSALIVTYNRRNHIARAIDSILRQITPVDEIVVVDDGSTDGTSEFISSHYGSQVRLVRQRNRGVSEARWRAVKEANGTWVAFLDSDDEWTLDRNAVLTGIAGLFLEKVAWIFGDLQIVTDKSDETTLFQKYGLQLTRDPQLFEDALSIHHPFQFCMLQSSLIRRDVLLEFNCFSEGLRHSEDVLAGYQVASRYQFVATPAVVTRLHRTSDLSSSSLNDNQQLRPDYYRARMLAFSWTVQSGRRQPWGELYANAVRGLCKHQAEKGLPIRSIALQQFKHSFSAKSLLFFCLTLPGSRFLRTVRSVYRGLKRASLNGKSLRLPKSVLQ